MDVSEAARRAQVLLGAVDRRLLGLASMDLVPIAHGLHGYMRDDDAPFIVCDQRRRDLPASVRSPAHMSSSVEAFTAAAGGSLCVRHSRAPRDIGALMKRIHSPRRRDSGAREVGSAEVELALDDERAGRGGELWG